MELYVRFMVTLAAGLVGLAVTLKVLFETVLSDWDPVVAGRRWWRELSHSRAAVDAVRAEDILEEIEGRRHGRYESRPADAIDRRRELLRDMRAADERVASTEPNEAL
jgi:hypothetical protein